MHKPLFKLPDKVVITKSDPWEDRKMILEIFCGYHEPEFKGIFKKREFRKLMFGSAGVGNKTMRHIYETAIKFEKNPPALAWKLMKLEKGELKKPR